LPSTITPRAGLTVTDCMIIRQSGVIVRDAERIKVATLAGSLLLFLLAESCFSRSPAI
jgi:hypothetical protein